MLISVEMDFNTVQVLIFVVDWAVYIYIYIYIYTYIKRINFAIMLALLFANFNYPDDQDYFLSYNIIKCLKYLPAQKFSINTE